MDDISEKLAELLNDPDSLNRVREMDCSKKSKLSSIKKRLLSSKTTIFFCLNINTVKLFKEEKNKN